MARGLFCDAYSIVVLGCDAEMSVVVVLIGVDRSCGFPNVLDGCGFGCSCRAGHDDGCGGGFNIGCSGMVPL